MDAVTIQKLLDSIDKSAELIRVRADEDFKARLFAETLEGKRQADADKREHLRLLGLLV